MHLPAETLWKDLMKGSSYKNIEKPEIHHRVLRKLPFPPENPQEVWKTANGLWIAIYSPLNPSKVHLFAHSSIAPLLQNNKGRFSATLRKTFPGFHASSETPLNQWQNVGWGWDAMRTWPEVRANKIREKKPPRPKEQDHRALLWPK